MAKGFNHERAAMVLCDAVIMGDRTTAQKWNLSLRTIQNYRARLDTDERLREQVAAYRDKQTEKWLEDIPTALSVFIKYCTHAVKEMDYNAENLMAVVAAFESLSDLHLTQKILESRLVKKLDIT